jgi:hypothetical protein
MLVSAREAARVLAEVGLTWEQARRLLRAGFAGPGTRTAGSLLYDAAQVRALLNWPDVDELDLAEACPDELFVARFEPQRSLDLLEPRDRQLKAVRRSWDLSLWTRVRLQHRVRQLGAVPFVGTVGGFVAMGADIVGLTLDRQSGEGPAVRKGATSKLGGDRELIRFELSEPGEWFETLRGRRLRTGRGGPWILWDARDAVR